MHKKTVASLLCLLLLMSLPTALAESLDSYLISTTLPLVYDIQVLASGPMITTATSMPEAQEECLKIASALEGEPTEAWVISFSEASVDQIIAIVAQDLELNDTEKTFLNKRVMVSLPQMINGRIGTNAIVASSVLTQNQSRIAHAELNENLMLFLLYEDQYAIGISFSPSLEGTVMVQASVIALPQGFNPAATLNYLGTLSEELSLNAISARKISNEELQSFLH